MANRRTRKLRSDVHKEFDKLWREGLLTRSEAYEWMAKFLNIDVSDAHISWLSEDQLKAVLTEYPLAYSVFLKRHFKKQLRKDDVKKRKSAQRITYYYVKRRKNKR